MDETLKIIATVGLVVVSLAVGTVLFFYVSGISLSVAYLDFRMGYVKV
jgi:hypothetical protein